MKKIISTLLILVSMMSLCVPTISIAEESTGLSENQLGLMNALSYISEDAFSSDGIVTRAEFCNMICKLFKYENYAAEEMDFRDIDNTHPYYNSVSALYAKGAVKGLSKYSMAPNKKITLDEASVIAVSALGYDTLAETGLKTYYTIANDLGIFDGIGSGKEEQLTEDNALKMMYNILFAPIMLYTGEGDGVNYKMNKNVTVLNEVYDIEEIKGIVSENGITSFYGESTISENEIKIGGTVYENEYADAADLIGYSVVAYIRENKGTVDDSLVYACKNEKKNNELEIESKDILSAEGTILEYEDGNKTRKIKLSSTLDVLYNGIGIDDDDVLAKIKPKCGKILLIDNNEDEVYDLVKVTDYKVIIVQSVLKSDTKTAIYDKKGNDLEINFDKVNCIVSYQRKNSASDISEVTMNSVLLVADSGERTNSRKIDILISTDKAKGVVTQVVEENITIDGKKIENNKYFDYTNASAYVGKSVECYLDYFGRAVYINSGSDGDYAYLFKIIYDDVDETVSAKILTPDNEWHTYKLKEKVRNNGTSMKAVDLYSLLLMTDTAGVTVTQRQMIRYKLNADETITELSTARDTYRTEDCDVDEDVDEKSREKGEFRRSMGKEERTYAHNIDSKGLFAARGYNNWLACFFDGTVPVLVRPESSKAQPESSIGEDDIAFYTQSYFKTDETYVCEGFDLTDGNAIKALVVYANLVPILDKSDRIIVVDHITEELDEDDQVVSKLYAWSQGTLMAFESEVDTAFKYGGKDVKSGDVVRLAKNAEGVVEEVKEMWFRLDDPVKWFSKNSNYNDTSVAQNTIGKPKYANCQIAIGRVSKIVGNYVRIQIDGEGEKGRYVNIQLRDATSYVVYDSENKKYPLRKGAKSDVGVGDIVVTGMYFAQLRDLIIYK